MENPSHDAGFEAVLKTTEPEQLKAPATSGSLTARHGKKGKNLPRAQVHLLEQWLQEHLAFPYPSKEEITTMAEKTGFTETQCTNWFNNARRRNKNLSKLPPDVLDTLQAWFNTHIQYPYPSDEDMERLSEITGCSTKRIEKWFAHSRNMSRYQSRLHPAVSKNQLPTDSWPTSPGATPSSRRDPHAALPWNESMAMLDTTPIASAPMSAASTPPHTQPHAFHAYWTQSQQVPTLSAPPPPPLVSSMQPPHPHLHQQSRHPPASTFMTGVRETMSNFARPPPLSGTGARLPLPSTQPLDMLAQAAQEFRFHPVGNGSGFSSSLTSSSSGQTVPGARTSSGSEDSNRMMTVNLSNLENMSMNNSQERKESSPEDTNGVNQPSARQSMSEYPSARLNVDGRDDMYTTHKLPSKLEHPLHPHLSESGYTADRNSAPRKRLAHMHIVTPTTLSENSTPLQESNSSENSYSPSESALGMINSRKRRSEVDLPTVHKRHDSDGSNGNGQSHSSTSLSHSPEDLDDLSPTGRPDLSVPSVSDSGGNSDNSNENSHHKSLSRGSSDRISSPPQELQRRPATKRPHGLSIADLLC